MPQLSLHSSVAAVAGAWRELEEAQPHPGPLASPALAEQWYACFSDPGRVAICLVRDGERPIGVLPLERRRRYGVSCLRSLANWHFALSEPLIRPGGEAAFVRCLREELFRQARGVTVLKLVNLYSFSAFAPALRDTPAQGAPCLGLERPTYCVDLRQGFEAYFRDFLKKKIRDNFKTNLKKMQTGLGLRLDFLRDEEALAQWERFTAIEDTGWKQAGHSSIRRLPDNYAAFYRFFTTLAAERRALRICLLHLGDKPAAGIFGFLDNGVFHAAKTGLHPDFAPYSASNILFIETVRHLIEHEPALRLLHLFPDDFGYKHRYCDTTHRCSTVVCTRRSPLGELARLSYRLQKRHQPQWRR